MSETTDDTDIALEVERRGCSTSIRLELADGSVLEVRVGGVVAVQAATLGEISEAAIIVTDPSGRKRTGRLRQLGL